MRRALVLFLGLVSVTCSGSSGSGDNAEALEDDAGSAGDDAAENAEDDIDDSAGMDDDVSGDDDSDDISDGDPVDVTDDSREDSDDDAPVALPTPADDDSREDSDDDAPAALPTPADDDTASADDDTAPAADDAPTPVASPSSSDCQSDGDGKTTLVFVNGCAEGLTFRGSDIPDGMLPPAAATCVDIGSDAEELPSKRYWGFLGEDPGGEHHTLAEFTFNTDFYDFDWYNISHVDAFNLPMQIAPLGPVDCETLTCAEDLLADCPEVGRFESEDGELVSCVSPERDDGSSEVALYFERCDDAYAWSGDDQNGEDPSPVRACAGEDWQITFCPDGG